jgi:hypothetical protein
MDVQVDLAEQSSLYLGLDGLMPASLTAPYAAGNLVKVDPVDLCGKNFVALACGYGLNKGAALRLAICLRWTT